MPSAASGEAALAEPLADDRGCLAADTGRGSQHDCSRLRSAVPEHPSRAHPAVGRRRTFKMTSVGLQVRLSQKGREVDLFKASDAEAGSPRPHYPAGDRYSSVSYLDVGADLRRGRALHHHTARRDIRQCDLRPLFPGPKLDLQGGELAPRSSRQTEHARQVTRKWLVSRAPAFDNCGRAASGRRPMLGS